MKRILCLIFSTFLGLESLSVQSVMAAGNDKNGTFQNPVIWADVPDMDVIRVDSDFYMVSTTMHLMPGAPVMHSRDLVNWRTVGYMFPRLTDSPKYDMQQGTVYGRGQWATSLKFHNGRYYALFAPNDNPGGETYILTAAHAEGPWQQVSRLRHFHDAALFFDDDNRVYVVYGTGEMVELTSDLKSVKEDTHTVLFQRDSDEKGLLEGSRMIKHDGKYYLLMISWTGGHLRREVCFRSDNIHGPYEKKVILETNFAGFAGVGQGTIVDAPNGKWYGLIFQDRGGVGRVPTLEPCTWKDGWPMLGDAEGNVPDVMEKPIQGYNGGAIVSSDDFKSKKLSLDWQWNHNPVDEAWSLNERDGWLRLKTSRVVSNIFTAPNTISQRMEGPESEAVIRMDVSKMKNGDVAGFCVFQGDAALLSVVNENGRKYIVATTESVELSDKSHEVTGDRRKEVLRSLVKKNIVYLKINADFRLGKDLATLSYSSDGKSWTPAIQNFKMTYDYRRMFMGSRFGIYNYATVAAGGYVDIDYFHYKK